MSGMCPAIVEGAFLSSVLEYIDCQARSVGALGFQALTAPGALVPAALAIILTLFVAIMGVRMLLGHAPPARELVLSGLKVGIVFALALSWSAYRTLLYDVALLGPADLSARISAPYSPASGSSDLVGQLQQVDYAFLELGRLGTGPRQLSSSVNVDPATGQPQVSTENSSEPPHIFETFSLGTARLAFLVGTVASLGAARLIAGLLLAIGPLFVILLLFDGTRSFFESWIRALAAAAIAAFAVTMLLAMEVSLMAPWLAQLLALRQAGYPVSGAATELLVVTFAFALILIAGLGMGARIAVAFRFGRGKPATAQPLDRTRTSDVLVPSPSAPRIIEARSSGLPSRAAATGEALAMMERREVLAASTGGTGGRGTAYLGDPQAGRMISSPSRHSRRTRTRVSAAALRRDVG